MNLQKFNFDFNKTYKELSSVVSRVEDDHKGSYHYLQNSDRFHDVIEKTIKYFEQLQDIESDYFKKIFWKTWKFNKLASYEKDGKKTNEGNNTSYELNENAFVDYQPDLDQKELIRKIRNCPTVNKVMEGYSVIEISKELGISRHTYYYRYHRDLKKIML